MVNGDVEHVADFILLSEMRYYHAGLLDALFRVELFDFHAPVKVRSVSDGTCCRSIDSHLGKKRREVFGLNSLTLFDCKAGGTEWILDHHLPYCPKTNPNVFAAKWGSFDSLSHAVGLFEPVSNFIVIISIWGKSDAEGTFALGGADALD